MKVFTQPWASINHLTRLNPKGIVATLLMIVTLTQSGCIDLAGLRKFTDSSVEAGKKFKELAADRYRSCASELYFLDVRARGFERIRLFESPDEFLKSQPAARKKQCDDGKSDSAKFVAANKVLMTYLYIMGQLAGDNVANTDKEFKDAKSALEGIPGGGDAFVGAALTVANTITNIFMDIQRQKAIKKAVLENEKHIGEVTRGLSRYLDTYITQLENERTAAKLMYEFALAEHIEFNSARAIKPVPMMTPMPDPPIQFDALAVVAGTGQLETEIGKLNSRIKAAKAFQKVLQEITEGHTELYAEAQRGFNKKRAVQIALKYAPSIQSSYDEIVKALD